MVKQKKQPILELKNVWKTYNREKVPIHVLRGIDLKIYPGDFVVILGKSGSGKSTLMNLMKFLEFMHK